MILLVVDIKDIKIEESRIPSGFIKNKYSVFEYKLINDILNNYYDISDFEIKYTENGKPYLEECSIFFSISHDRDLLAICFDNKNVGIDLQFYNNNSVKAKEFLGIGTYNSKEVIDTFSKREAVIKLEGKTLKDINDIDVTKYDIKSFSNNEYTINIAYLSDN